MYLRTVRGDTWIPSFTNNSLAICSSPHTGFSPVILRIKTRSSSGIRGRPGQHFHLQNNLQPARCHRIIVFGRTTNSASRHSKHLARMAKLIRVAESIRRGWTPRSLNSASCRRRNRFSAWTDRVGRNSRIENRTASARRWTAIMMSATIRSSCHSPHPKPYQAPRPSRREYLRSTLGGNPFAALTDPTNPATNGLLIYDLSQIQARVLNPQVRLISSLLWKDGSVAQHTIPVKIGGKPYVVFVDEAGSGGLSSLAQATGPCAAGFTPFPMARIIDISDETNPAIVSRLMLEIHAAKSCPMVLPDIVGLATFTYGSHYCSVDNKRNATTLACGYFNAGVRFV